MRFKQGQMFSDGKDYIRLGTQREAKAPIGRYFVLCESTPTMTIGAYNRTKVYEDWLKEGGFLYDRGFRLVDSRKVPLSLRKILTNGIPK